MKNSNPISSHDIRRLWKSFGLGEMQSIVAGAMGNPLAERSLIDVLRPQLEDRNSTLRTVMKKTCCGASGPRLLDKLVALTARDERDLANAVSKLHSQFEPGELFGHGLLPDASILRANGFAAPAQPVATAFCVFVLKDESYHHEVVLYNDLATISADESLSVDEYAENALRLVRLMKSDYEEEDRVWLARVCYQLVVKTGCHHLRVEAKGDEIKVIPIPVKDLRSDLADGSLRSLSLAGTNVSA